MRPATCNITEQVQKIKKKKTCACSKEENNISWEKKTIRRSEQISWEKKDFSRKKKKDFPRNEKDFQREKRFPEREKIDFPKI